MPSVPVEVQADGVVPEAKASLNLGGFAAIAVSMLIAAWLVWLGKRGDGFAGLAIDLALQPLFWLAIGLAVRADVRARRSSRAAVFLAVVLGLGFAGLVVGGWSGASAAIVVAPVPTAAVPLPTPESKAEQVQLLAPGKSKPAELDSPRVVYLKGPADRLLAGIRASGDQFFLGSTGSQMKRVMQGVPRSTMPVRGGTLFEFELADGSDAGSANIENDHVVVLTLPIPAQNSLLPVPAIQTKLGVVGVELGDTAKTVLGKKGMPYQFSLSSDSAGYYGQMSYSGPEEHQILFDSQTGLVAWVD